LLRRSSGTVSVTDILGQLAPTSLQRQPHRGAPPASFLSTTMPVTCTCFRDALIGCRPAPAWWRLARLLSRLSVQNGLAGHRWCLLASGLPPASHDQKCRPCATRKRHPGFGHACWGRHCRSHMADTQHRDSTAWQTSITETAPHDKHPAKQVTDIQHRDSTA
jgi:hypothetical protein